MAKDKFAGRTDFSDTELGFSTFSKEEQEQIKELLITSDTATEAEIEELADLIAGEIEAE